MRAPLSDDEAIYMVVARELLSGRTLYRDAADNKPPGLFLLYSVTEGISSTLGGWIVHLATAVVVWATALGLAALVRHLRPAADAATAMWAALAYVAFTTTMMPFDGLAANAELWMLLPTVWALRLVLTAPVCNATVACQAGVLAGIATLFKYQGIAIVPVLVLAVWWRGGGAAVVCRRWIALSTGILLPGVAWWAHARVFGDASEAGYWLMSNVRYTAAGIASPDLFARTLQRVGFAVVPAAALYVWAVRGAWRGVRHRDRELSIITVWAMLSALAVSLGGRWFGHYFHQLTAPLAVLLGVALADGVPRRWLAPATLLPVAGFWMVAWCTPLVMQRIGTPMPTYEPIVAALDAMAPRTASVCVWGNAPRLLEQARRPLGCRFVTAHFITGASPATAAQTNAQLADRNIVPGMWERFLSDLDQRQPTFVIDLSPGNVAQWGPFPPRRYPALATRLSQAYVPVAHVGGAAIYRLR